MSLALTLMCLDIFFRVRSIVHHKKRFRVKHTWTIHHRGRWQMGSSLWGRWSFLQPSMHQLRHCYYLPQLSVVMATYIPWILLLVRNQSPTVASHSCPPLHNSMWYTDQKRRWCMMPGRSGSCQLTPYEMNCKTLLLTRLSRVYASSPPWWTAVPSKRSEKSLHTTFYRTFQLRLFLMESLPLFIGIPDGGFYSGG